MKKINRGKLGWILIFILSFLRIGLTIKMPLTFNSLEDFDDAVLIRYAESIFAGNWLGDYNNLTLVKGISYSFFIDLAQWIFVPYTLLLGMFNILAAGLFVNAIKKSFKKKWILGIIYILLIYSPVGFSFLISQRVYRMAVIPYAVLSTFSCIIGLYIRRHEKVRDKLPWAIGGGICLFFFWNVREDSIWIVPFVAVVTLIIISDYLFVKKDRGRLLLKNITVAFTPIVILIVGQIGICSLNFHYYGVFTTNDRSGTHFGEVMSLLYKMDAEDKNQNIWVSFDAMEKAMDASDTLNSIRPSLESSLGAWGQEGEIKGDLIAWTIRDAVQSAGYYENAKKANEFYKNVAEELRQAYKDGTLKEKKAIYFSSQSTGIQLDEIPNLVSKTISRIGNITNYEVCDAHDAAYASGSWGKIRAMEAITGGIGTYPSQDTFELNGWVFAKNDKDRLKAEIVDKDNKPIANVNFFESKDVKGVYNFKNAENARFEVNIVKIKQQDLYMNIYINEKLYKRIELRSYSDDLCMADMQYKWNGENDSAPIYAKRAADIGNTISKTYQKFTWIVAIISIIAYITLFIIAINNLFKRKWELCDEWIMITGIFLSAFVLVFGIVTFTQWFDSSMSHFINFYAAGAYPLIQMSKYYSIGLFIERVLLSINKNKKRIKSN